MASKTLPLILSITSLLIFIISTKTSAQTPSSPPPTSSTTQPNITGILEKGGQYKTLILIMNKNQLATQLQNQLNTSSEGLTLLAPTDNAFNNLPSGTINDLTQQEQVELILSHVLTKFYALTDFTTVSNPVRTQGRDGLNFTSHGNNQVNVSSGIVETQINNVLRQEFSLAVYQVDKVLLPLSIFGAKPPASDPPPPPPSAPDASNKTEADATGSPSGSDRMDLGAGLVAGFMLMICMGAFF